MGMTGRLATGEEAVTPGGVAGLPFDHQPLVEIVDGSSGATVHGKVVARLEGSAGCGKLTGTLSVPILGGRARFTDLMIDAAGFAYELRLCVGSCSDGPTVIADGYSGNFTIRTGTIQVRVNADGAMAGSEFLVQPVVHVRHAVKDKQGRRYLTTDRDYDYSVRVFLNRDSPQLRGRTTVWPANGVARFTDLRIDGTGYAEKNFRLVFTSCMGRTEVSGISFRGGTNFVGACEAFD
jgi:hypothetical protein